jgi:hypothetical protein
MRLYALPAVALAVISATSTNDMPKYELAEVDAESKVGLAPLAAYGAAKKIADGVCLIWNNREALMKLGKAIYNGLKHVG